VVWNFLMLFMLPILAAVISIVAYIALEAFISVFGREL
jgi:hypothetical protein